MWWSVDFKMIYLQKLLSAVWQAQINHMKITVDAGKSHEAAYVV